MQSNLQNLNHLSAHQKPSSTRRLWWVTILVVLAGSIIGLYYRQNIVDYVVASQFKPSVKLGDVLSNTYLNDRGVRHVYASQTKVVDKEEFNQYCGSLQNEKTIVLGCYSPADKQIFIYDVTDSRLEGVREATTAHEMLHAVWDRLSFSEKKRLEVLLNVEASEVTDQRLNNLFAQYRESDPDSMPNELHSILGTEVIELSPGLEAHYSKYFSDRKALVGQTKKYENVFVDIENRRNAIIAEMEILSDSLDKRSSAYEQDLSILGRDIESFNYWAQSGNATATEFSRRRSILLGNIRDLESDRVSINSDVNNYNLLRQDLLNLNLLAEDLNQSLDSKLLPVPEAPSL